MKITVHTSKSVKPAYGSGSGRDTPAATTSIIPLTVFDEVNHDEYIPGIFFFHPPAPPAAVLEAGLAMVLAEYREWAGRLVTDDPRRGGRRAILLNDAGARLVEASADVALAAVMPLPMGPEAQQLHPSRDRDGAEELFLVQVTRFPCCSFTVGYNIHHSVSDGYAASTCLVAWGRAVRGVPFGSAPVRDRTSFFRPRDPPLVEFEHRGVEFKPRAERNLALDNNGGIGADDDVVVETVHFSREFISQLKSLASMCVGECSRPYSTMKCVTAHLWRCVTVARGLGMDEVTKLHIAVNGRAAGRVTEPGVPEGYTGNAVLWARPAAVSMFKPCISIL